MKTRVAPRAACTSVSRLMIAAWTETSSAETGSSARMMSGSPARAAAVAAESAGPAPALRKAAENTGERRLAAAASADDGEGGAALGGKLDVTQSGDRAAGTAEDAMRLMIGLAELVQAERRRAERRRFELPAGGERVLPFRQLGDAHALRAVADRAGDGARGDRRRRAA